MGIVGGKGVLEGGVEMFIEMVEDGGGVVLWLGYVMEVVLKGGSKVIVEDVGEILDEEMIE